MFKLEQELHHAVQARDTGAVSALLTQGTDLHAVLPGRNEFMRSPLQCAVQQGDVEMTRLLLRHGADPNQCTGNPEANTPMIEALLKVSVHDASIRGLPFDKPDTARPVFILLRQAGGDLHHPSLDMSARIDAEMTLNTLEPLYLELLYLADVQSVVDELDANTAQAHGPPNPRRV